MKELNEIMVREIHRICPEDRNTWCWYMKPMCTDRILQLEQKPVSQGYYGEDFTTGPHRDDLSFMVNDIDIRKFGSQGQQSTGACH